MEANDIGCDLDADVTATPNYLIAVLDPAAPDVFGRTVTSTFRGRRADRSELLQTHDEVNLFGGFGPAQRLWLTTSTLCPSGSRTNAP